jgi:Putative transposase DNA-binding domain
MIERLSYDGGCVMVHATERSLKTTKAFTHGSLAFDTQARTATFAQFPPVAVPEEILLTAGETLSFQLVGPDGKPRKQVRSGVLTADKKRPEILRIGGMAQTPRKFSAEDGWCNEIYQYRAYFIHPGSVGPFASDRPDSNGPETKINPAWLKEWVGTDLYLVKGSYCGNKIMVELPQWLIGCIERQKALWNRLAWLCRDARRQCSPVPTAQIQGFVANTILPEIDAYNLMLGRERSKEKMRHPTKLKIEEPGVDGLWRFVGELRGRIEKKRAVPEGLLEKVVAFAEQFKADYTPLNAFMNGFAAIAEREAQALGLKRFEIRPTVGAFKAVLNRRKSTKVAWSEGWPRLKYPDSPNAANWGVHYYFNKAGVDSALLESGVGVPGLCFGPPAPAREIFRRNRARMRAETRTLREAVIAIPNEGSDNSKAVFRFAVLQHRPFPPNSHLKEWKLIYQDGKLWLNLVVELQRPVPQSTEWTAGLEIGWRRTKEGIRMATLYEPVTKTVREVTLDLEQSPKGVEARVPFRIDLGPTRWEKRNVLRLFPDWKPGDGIPNAVETRTALAARRDYLKDTAKILLRKHLGERTPAWLVKAGSQGLQKVRQEFLDDPVVQEIVEEWTKKNRQIAELVAWYFERTTRRIHEGHALVAHDICRYLKEKSIGRLVVESKFLAKVSQQHDNEDPESLKRSQKYRQFAASAEFVSVLKNTAVKYGIAVEEHENVNLTRTCHYCDYLNLATEKEKLNCEGCGREIQQDHNAAINLSRWGGEPERQDTALPVEP